MFSVIIPLYNKEKTIGQAIWSVLNQSYSDFEVVVVNDGSTDNSAQIVKAICDIRILFIDKENGGVASARNAGIEKANGEWLLFLDADDELASDCLKSFNDGITKYSDKYIFVAGERVNGNRHVPVVMDICKYPFFFAWLNKLHPRPGALLVHRHVVETCGKYDMRMSFYEDYEFFLRVFSYGAIVTVPYVSVFYNQNSIGLSSSSHPIEKEMAYYIPTMQTYSFWHKALLYENLQLAKLWWQGHVEETAYYDKVERQCFDWRFRLLHWIRQKLVRKGVI